MNQKYIISASPHIHSENSVAKCMYGVLIALIPAFIVSVFYFGLGALVVTATSVLACVIFEYLISRFLLERKPDIADGSAILTGVLLAFNLPSNLPIWIIIIGALAAIGIGKMSFGGLGCNIFNPALVGRVFLLISFPAQMASWPLPGTTGYLDAKTGATVLSILKSGATFTPEYSDMLLGNMGGSLGEVGSIALLLGFVYLLWKKIITWHIPVSILVTVAVFSALIGMNPVVQLLSGGLLLGAIFMATDYVTSPLSQKGMIIYGILIGLLTVIIRRWGIYPEGVSFAILIMNAFTPLINMYIKPKRFGKVVHHG
ncbi:RnfABCDGE type electron transport complex subunit D [Coprobacter tertius]|uniref:Ion-translocating oxidoreductase complex subunit D n=1 Tax=Coprobacter tertius TaxID=2944915 RepID=A0ABT1MH57_9BACT|nr:RnfABCDGE type electron transport complex subunit D [Coprobacter tertius]MCP9611968.1 RnfABCDGE type electron transport complex subunit D [Coprobacter tertius]